MTVFLLIGGAGILLAALTLILGDLLDAVLHLDALDAEVFSISSLSAFIGAFGFGGAVGLWFTENTLVAVVVGLIVGALAAWAAIRLTRALKRDDGTSFRSDFLVGHSARVITAIPESGYGEITLTAGGHIRKLSARASGPVPSGTEVWISAVLSPTAVEVTPAGRGLPQ